MIESMISMIADEGKRPKGSDGELLHAFNNTLGKSPYYGKFESCLVDS